MTRVVVKANVDALYVSSFKTTKTRINGLFWCGVIYKKLSQHLFLVLFVKEGFAYKTDEHCAIFIGCFSIILYQSNGYLIMANILSSVGKIGDGCVSSQGWQFGILNTKEKWLYFCWICNKRHSSTRVLRQHK